MNVRRATRGAGLQRPAAALVILCCGWLGWLGIRTWRATADQQAAKALAAGQSSAARRQAAQAIRYRPDEAEGWRLRARYTSFARPRMAAAYARRAVALDPGDWRNWRTLGLIEFQLGDLPAARQAFEHGAEVDHGFASHFQLGNLALLTGDRQGFWRQMQAALEMAPASRVNVVLQQALGVDPGGNRLAAIFPRDRPPVDAQATIFLANHRDLAAARAAWRDLRCPGYDRQPCRTAALLLADRYMYRAYGGGGAANVGVAMRVWNQAVQAGVLRQPLARTGVCNDGEFQHRWAGPAFSWTSLHTVYTEIMPGAAPAGNAVRIGFDGYQNDYTDVFLQYVPVRPGAVYAISYASRRVGAGEETGLNLRVWAAGQRWLVDIPAALNNAWSTNRGQVRVPKDSAMVELAFTYSRPEGQIRLQNPVLIGKVQMRELRP